jgi:hypothetical protein
VQGCDPALLLKYDLNPDRIETPAARLRRHPLKMVQWPGDQPVAAWGYVEGPEEAAPEWHTAEAAIRMMRRFARAETRGCWRPISLIRTIPTSR